MAVSGPFDDDEPAGMPPSEFPPDAVDQRPKVVPLKQKAPEAAFPCTWVGDAVLQLDTKPIIKGLLDPGAFAVIYGPSGSGKSFFTADIAQHVAQGLLWRGRKVSKGLVVYVAAEAGSSILKRFVGWREERLGEAAGKIPLAILTRGPNLLASVEFEKFSEQLKALQVEAELPLVLVIFDTLSRSIPGGDENKAEDMTQAIRAADYLRDEFNCATAFVHHTGKDPVKGVRGSSTLFAAADLVILIMDKTATVEKVRDGVAGEQFGFELSPIEIGTDADGEAVYTCLLNATNEVSKPLAKPTVLKGRTKLGLDSLRSAISASGQVMPGTTTIPKGVKAVKLDQWREHFDRMYGKDNTTPASQAFYKARETLLGERILISDPYVWLT